MSRNNVVNCCSVQHGRFLSSPEHLSDRHSLSSNTLPREIVSLSGQEAILCLWVQRRTPDVHRVADLHFRSCAERQYASGKIAHLSLIHSNIKYNKILGLLNRTFRTLYELSQWRCTIHHLSSCSPSLVDDLPVESNEHIEEKKEAISEGVRTCLTLIRPSIREHNQKTPTVEPKKKIIIRKKNFDILHDGSDNDEDKENESMTPVLTEENRRRTTARGSNPSKRPASSKQQENDENESPPKRSKKTNDLDAPLPIISPAVAKKSTPTRKKPSTDGEEKKALSIRFTRKVQSKTDADTSSENIDKLKKDESNTSTEVVMRRSLHSSTDLSHFHLQEKSVAAKKKPVLATKSSIDIRNDKGESLLHQAVKKGDVARVKQLIDDGNSVNTVDNNSWTPLHEVSNDLSLRSFLSCRVRNRSSF